MSNNEQIIKPIDYANIQVVGINTIIIFNSSLKSLRYFTRFSGIIWDIKVKQTLYTTLSEEEKNWANDPN